MMTFLNDLALRIAFMIALHGVLLAITGALALVFSTGASLASENHDRPWRWWGWFALLKGFAVIGLLGVGVAEADRSQVFYDAFYLGITLPAWLAGAQFAWSSWQDRPTWARCGLPVIVWSVVVLLTALTSGWAGLGQLNRIIAGVVGIALTITFIRKLRSTHPQRSAQMNAGLLLIIAGTVGLVVLECLGNRYTGRFQGWTMNTLPHYVREEFGLMLSGTICAFTLTVGWWIWIRRAVLGIHQARVWLKHALWLVPAGMVVMSISGFGLLNHIKTSGSDRADNIFYLRARTAVTGLQLAGLQTDISREKLAGALETLAAANPDLETIAWARMENGKLVTLVSTSPELPLPERPSLWHKAGATDTRFTESQVEFSSAFMQDATGCFALYCEPWPAAGEGWLIFRVTFDSWASTMGPVLMQATCIIFLLSVAGVTLVIFFLQRELGNEARLNFAKASAASQAKSELLSRASHELRTPIHGVLGYADLLERSSLDDRQQEWLGALRSQGRHLLQVVNDLLDFGALQNGRLRIATEPTSLTSVARESISAVRPQAEANALKCSWSQTPGVPGWVLGDSTRLRQIVVNLLGNAVKFTETGSVELLVTTAGLPTEDGRRRIIFCVTDTGPGIAPDDLPTLFDPRGRPHRHPAEGAGLGLALTRSLCEAMGGSLRVHSELGRGSTFTATVLLPLTEAPATAVPERKTARRLPSLGLRVLAVEDNTALRALLGAWLEELDCLPLPVADGASALKQAAKTRFDAVVLDLGLPGIDGFEVARQLRSAESTSNEPKRWIIGLSAHASDADREAALAAGMDVFLSKPIGLPELAAALQRMSTTTSKPRSRSMLDTDLLTPQQISDLRATVLAEIPARLEALDTAVQAGHWQQVAAAAHYLSNSADLLGAGEMSNACRACENAACDGDAATASQHAEDILRLGVELDGL